MRKEEQSPEIQDFENQSPEDAAIEPANGTDNVADESFDEAANVTEECCQWQDKYIRLMAEFDNYRKRTLKEKMDLIANGGEDVLKSIIDVADDFERALQAMEKRDDVEAEMAGVKLIYVKFMDILRSKGVTPIETDGKPFNVDLHDAVAKFPVDDPSKKGMIIDVAQRGYMLRDKVLRFAKVIVGE